jgi:glucosylceramidase
VYFTPLYYTMAHFSKFIRPGAVRIGFNCSNRQLMVTAAQNPDGTVAVVVFNPGEEEREVHIKINGTQVSSKISAKAIQTIVIKK